MPNPARRPVPEGFLWGTAISANPYISFFAIAADSGSFEFEWTDDDGTIYRQTAPILVA